MLGALVYSVEEQVASLLPVVARYVAAALVFIIGLVIAVIARKAAERSFLRAMPRDVANIVEKLIYYGIVALAAVSALSVAGVEATGFLVAGSIVGVALGFASQTVVSNFLSGIFLYIDKPFKPGDAVEIDGIGGVITDITIFSTRIRTWDGIHTRLPNSKVFEATIRNYVGNVVRRVEYRVGISYSADINKAIEVIRRVLEEHPLVLAEPEPMVFVEDLGDSAVILNVRFWAPSSHWFQAKAELLKLIKEALDREGIEIPFPQRVVWLRGVERAEVIVSREKRTGSEDSA
ncbi:MscS Mechanosensitive ion channel [Pyrolobus fumarii 1A]|uniref:MscS Mechanosensitive ion channel n=1 Tax=Pyrolobus fumarii (strain DSM 11204 / 1A) TaxID=694429 RepID=G0ED87_PYRF1|nr:mechanosensitive ion channel family protein [Pyrolobus fumarii]AEM39765.1 MscS Mechanosensitive ion channel [Pyrolobus fumarii 1A]